MNILPLGWASDFNSEDASNGNEAVEWVLRTIFKNNPRWKNTYCGEADVKECTDILSTDGTRIAVRRSLKGEFYIRHCEPEKLKKYNPFILFIVWPELAPEPIAVAITKYAAIPSSTWTVLHKGKEKPSDIEDSYYKLNPDDVHWISGNKNSCSKWFKNEWSKCRQELLRKSYSAMSK